MRPIWSGSISFGLINIPINLYSGSIDHAINLDMLHKKDLSPIRYAKMCKVEDKEVTYEDIVKGFEYEKGRYVVVTEEDFAKVNPKKSKMIELQCFVDEGEIDPIYFEKPYFLEPAKGAAKTYLLLNEALRKSKKVGIATYVVHTKAHLGVIKPYGRGLILNQLRFKSEVKNFAEIELPIAKIQPKEVDIAVKLIDQLTERFNPNLYKDTYSEELRAVIEAKLKGKKLPKTKEAVETVSTPVEDIMKKLKDSLEHYSKPTRKPHVGPSRRRKVS